MVALRGSESGQAGGGRVERSRGEEGVRGQRGKGAPRLQSGASRRGPQRSGLPFQPGWGHASPAPAPTPPPGTPPQGGSGEIPSPGDFRNPGVWAARSFPEPWRPPSPAPRAVTTACLPHRLCPRTQAHGGPAPRLFSPEPANPVPGSRLSWHPDIAGHPHPALLAQTISAQRGDSPRAPHLAPARYPWRTQVSRRPPPPRRPRAAARDSGPSRDLGRKQQLLRAGPPFPSPAAPPHAFAFPGQPLLLRGPGQPSGCGGPWGGGGRRGARKPSALEGHFSTRATARLFLASICLPWIPWSAAGKLEDWEEGGLGRSGKVGVGPRGVVAAQPSPEGAVSAQTQVRRPGSGSPSFPNPALKPERH
nr:basic proline-rich protein-like [Equus asinus]